MLRPPLALLVLSLATPLLAQSTEADLRTRLLNKPLYLRGQWRDDKLSFDETGHLLTPSNPASFTLSGIDINSMKLKSNSLILTGQRVGVEFAQDIPKRVGLQIVEGARIRKESLQVEIRRPRSGNYDDVLNGIFTDGLADLVPALPPVWETFTRRYLAPSVTPAPDLSRTINSPISASPISYRAGGNVIPPTLLHDEQPEFTDSAKALRYSAKVSIDLVVDDTGKPARLQIVHPAGLGLDERAVAAVARYTFTPGTQYGLPVPVEISIEVNFEVIYGK